MKMAVADSSRHEDLTVISVGWLDVIGCVNSTLNLETGLDLVEAVHQVELVANLSV